MDIPAERWYSVIEKRRSIRRFDPRPLADDLASGLSRICDEFRPFPAARAVFFKEAPDTVFRGALFSYGKIKGAPAFIAFIGKMDTPNVQEQSGYMGEGIILEAQALGLATCWVGGFFRPDVVHSLTRVERNERVLAVTPVGYAAESRSLEERVMTGFGLSHKRRPLADQVTGMPQAEWPQWIKIALEAARLAPSASNRQPWGFEVDKDSIAIYVRASGLEFGVSKRLDCGIAMLHVEAAALSQGFRGRWEFLEPPNVARYLPNHS